MLWAGGQACSPIRNSMERVSKFSLPRSHTVYEIVGPVNNEQTSEFPPPPKKRTIVLTIVHIV